MKIQIVDDTMSEESFDQKAHHPLQSYAWGEARKKTGLDILRLQDDENVYTMTLHSIPYTPYKIGYIPRSVHPSDDILAFLKDWGKNKNIVFIKFEPYVEKYNEDHKLATKDLFVSPHPLFPSWTQMLNLDKPEEELFKDLKQKTRYNIRLAEKKGVVVREESTDEGFEKFLKLYFDTCARQNYHGHTPEYHRQIWNSVKGSIAKILIAYYEDEPLAAYELFYFKNRFYYPYGGSSEKHRNLMATNLLMWKAILFGRELGAKRFDLWGSLPSNYDPNDKWAGFTRFKEGYGTEFVAFIGSYDLVINPTLYKMYNVANQLRSRLL